MTLIADFVTLKKLSQHMENVDRVMKRYTLFDWNRFHRHYKMFQDAKKQLAIDTAFFLRTDRTHDFEKAFRDCYYALYWTHCHVRDHMNHKNLNSQMERLSVIADAMSFIHMTVPSFQNKETS